MCEPWNISEWGVWVRGHSSAEQTSSSSALGRPLHGRAPGWGAGILVTMREPVLRLRGVSDGIGQGPSSRFPLTPAFFIASSFCLCGQQGSDCHSECGSLYAFICVCVFDEHVCV